MTDPARGDQAFLAGDNHQTWPEMTYGGALSFARRRYSRSLENVEVVVSGIPYDCAVTNRSGCRLGPRAIRAGSTQLAELKHFPFGFNPFDHLSVTIMAIVILIRIIRKVSLSPSSTMPT